MSENENANQEVIPEISILFTPKSQESKGIDRRAHKRFNARLNVTIIKEKKTFSTLTVNISLGGLLLANPVPEDFFGSLCKVHISSADNSLFVSFEAKVLEASVRGSRI